MADDDGPQAGALEELHRIGGLMAVGEADPDRKDGTGKTIPSTTSTEAEREHNARVFGLTYRERNNAAHDRCIVLCVGPNPGRVNRCPSCYGKAAPMDIYMARMDPMPSRAERIARWAGGVLGAAAGAFAEAVTFPFRVGRAHTAALVRDIMQEA